MKKTIPIMRWNTEGCDENDLCIRLDEPGNGEKFRKAIVDNDMEGVWACFELISEKEWKEIEANSDE